MCICTYIRYIHKTLSLKKRARPLEETIAIGNCEYKLLVDQMYVARFIKRAKGENMHYLKCKYARTK